MFEAGNRRFSGLLERDGCHPDELPGYRNADMAMMSLINEALTSKAGWSPCLMNSSRNNAFLRKLGSSAEEIAAFEKSGLFS